MDKTFMGNDLAYRTLSDYLKMESPGPLILYGQRGTGKRAAAEAVCCELLGCGADALYTQPDFFLLDKKGEEIKVMDILAVILKSGISAFKERKVFLILGADRMNEQAQNKLLKLLEDRNRTNTVILVCEENCLLHTIRSRCITVGFQHIKKPEMDRYLTEQGVSVEDLDLYGFLCGNCPYRTEDVRECFQPLKAVMEQILAIKDRREILSILHLVKEKDTEEFYSAHSAHFDTALTMLLYVFKEILAVKSGYGAKEEFSSLASHYSSAEVFQISLEIQRHRGRHKRGSYTKNDFFDLARVII